jgi:hypothetical protein
MRLRRARVDAPDAPFYGRLPRRDPAVAARGLPLERDEQLGRIFRNMRLSMKVSRELIARRLATSVATVENLEAGSVAQFPHWRESERIVRTYCELLRLDPEPILWRMRTQLAALANAQSPPRPPYAVGAGSPPRAQPPARSFEPERSSPRRRRRNRALFALSTPIALAAVLLCLLQVAPVPVYRTIAILPNLLQKPLRAGLDQLMLLTAPHRDGLIWVDISDPRARKADKLAPGR